MDVKEALSRKVAGMPLYLWALGVGGGLAVAYYLRNHSTSGDVAGDAMDGYTYDAITDGTGGAAVSDPSWFGTGGGSTGIGTTPVEPDVEPEDTDYPVFTDYPPEPVDPIPTGSGAGGNNAWRRAAIAALMAGGVGGIRAQRTVDAYLSGRINRTQRKLLDRVLPQVGAPPKGGAITVVKRKGDGQRDDRKPQQQPRQDKPNHPFTAVKPNPVRGPRREDRRDNGTSMVAQDTSRAPQGRATARPAPVFIAQPVSDKPKAPAAKGFTAKPRGRK